MNPFAVLKSSTVRTGGRRGRLSGLPAFALVSVGQAISLFGSGLTTFAVGVWVFQSTGSVSKFLLVGFFSRIASVLTSPLVGTLVDRFDRRAVIVLTDLGAGLGTLLLALLFLWHRADFSHVCAVVAFQGLLGAAQFPALSALTTQMVRAEDFSRASGFGELARSMSLLLAPLVAGTLLSLIGIGSIMVLDFITILPGTAALLLVDVGERPASRRGSGERRRSSYWGETLEGWLYLRSRRGLVGILVLFAIANFAFISVQALLTPLVLGFASARALGLVLSVSGCGLVVGSGLMTLWPGPRNRIGTILALMGVQGVILAVGGSRASTLLVAVAAFAYISAQPIINTCSQAIWLRKVDLEVQGRVFAIRRMVASATVPLAYLTAGPLVDRVFAPLMAPGGALAGTVGRVIGTGPGRGIGLMFGVMGILTVGLVLVASSYKTLRRLETDLPDAGGMRSAAPVS